MRKVWLNDVALRESAQVAGGAMSPDDQNRYVELLVNNGIDIIEIGFPASSAGEFVKCQRIVQLVSGMDNVNKPVLSGLARAIKADVLAVKRSGCEMVHIYIPVSDDLMLAQFDEVKYGDTQIGKQTWMIDTAVEMVHYAKSLGFEYIQFSPEDSARSGRSFLCRIVEAVIAAGATSVNIPDTTGLCILGEFGDLIKCIFENVSNIAKARIACHCHNDSDHGTANALQGIVNGVSEVHGTFYGLGERSGMTKFESLIMNVKTRRDIFTDVEIGFESQAVVELVTFVANSLGMPMPRHWVVTGEQNCICSSGSHQSIEDRAKKKGMPSPYYSWKPELYGHGKVQTVLTQFSGRVGLAAKLKELGFSVDSKYLKRISTEVNRISKNKKGDTLEDREIAAIVSEVVREIPHKITFSKITMVGGEGTIPIAAVRATSEGGCAEDIATGNGPITALFNAVLKAVVNLYPVLGFVKIEMVDWRPIVVTTGNDSLGDVYVRIKVTRSDKKVSHYSSHSVADDTSKATAQAFADSLSWAIADLVR